MPQASIVKIPVVSDIFKLLTQLLDPTPQKGDDKEAKSESEHADPDAQAAAVTADKVSGWRPAKSLLRLREQVNAAAPHRSTASDGIIGDADHKKRDSDHNPWVDDNGVGVVTAIDITHDPARGCDAGLLAEAIVGSQDKRVKYVIWNRQIANFQALGGKPAWAWRPYHGSNPHDHHVHVSVRPEKAAFDSTANWTLWKGAAKPSSGAALMALAEVPSIVPTFDKTDEIAWGKKVPAAFKHKVVEICNRLQMDPNVLMSVMAFETGRQFKSDTPSISGSGATGLIQFMPSTAKGMGTTTAALAKMTEVEQLDYVEKYLKPFTGKMVNVASAYMAVLYPVAVPKPTSFVLFQSPSKAYTQNKGLDADNDGKVTKAEASARVNQQLVEGMRPENFG